MQRKRFLILLGLATCLASPPGSLQAANDRPAAPAGSPASSDGERLVTPVPGGLLLTSPAFQRLYGPGVFTMTSLANTVVGVYHTWERILSNRFRATISGDIDHIRIFLASGIGYSNGNGGTIQISLYPDDGSPLHLPDLNAQPLASTVIKPGLPPDRRKKGYFPDVRFSGGSKAVQAGQIYHLVFRNIDQAPDHHFISIDHSATPAQNGRPARWLNTIDWSTLYATRRYQPDKPGDYAWVNLTERGSSGHHFSPIMQIVLRDGQSQGVSDTESGSVDPQRIYTARAGLPVREHFKPGSDKRISGFSVATAAAAGGALQWRIMQGDKVLGSGRIQQQEPNYQPIESNTGILLAKYVWYDVALPKDIRMKAGESYYLEFAPLGSSQWVFAAHSNGLPSGFSWPAAFTESQAQHWRKGAWINSYPWNYSRTTRGTNWPVVLHLAP